MLYKEYLKMNAMTEHKAILKYLEVIGTKIKIEVVE